MGAKEKDGGDVRFYMHVHVYIIYIAFKFISY